MRAILIGLRLALKTYRVRWPLGMRLALRAYPGAALIRRLQDAERVRRALRAGLFEVNLRLLKEFTAISETWKREPWYREFDRGELRMLYGHYRHLRDDPRGQRWPKVPVSWARCAQNMEKENLRLLHKHSIRWVGPRDAMHMRE